LMTYYDGKSLPLRLNSVKHFILPSDIYSSERLVLKFCFLEPVQGVELKREYFIFPEIPVIGVNTYIKTPVLPQFYSSANFQKYPVKRELMENPIDGFACRKNLSDALSVSFFGVTDMTNELVNEKFFKVFAGKERRVSGNMLFAENRKASSGMFFVREAPSSIEDRPEGDCNFIIGKNRICSLDWGIQPMEFKNEEMRAYSSALGVFSGGYHSGTAEFKRYFTKRFHLPETAYKTMANPWGGGGAKWQKKISNEFIAKEIEASAAMGLEMYQIDDGWQRGSFAEMVKGNRAMTVDDWGCRKDIFPNGFKEIKEVCEETGVELCLWFAPSFNKAYRDWEEQAELLYRLHRDYGINVFKIDGVVVESREAENNLRRLLYSLRERSKGKIYFNLDTTSGRRPGYLFFQEFGNVFLENRYQAEPGTKRYEPWKTLRNLWRLSEYVPTQRLQVEFPDIGKAARFKDNYRDSSYPEKFKQEYLAAITLFATPLCWSFASGFKPAAAASVRRIMELHKELRHEIRDSVVIPIGEEADGVSWPGFQAHDFSSKRGLLLLFREETSDAEYPFNLQFLENCDVEFECIYGGNEKFTVTFKENVTFAIGINEVNSFKVYRYLVE